MIGKKLAHYEITSHLGSGGMGEVYAAADSKLGRSVAIKCLPDAFNSGKERVARFQREARVLASLNLPILLRSTGLKKLEGATSWSWNSFPVKRWPNELRVDQYRWMKLWVSLCRSPTRWRERMKRASCIVISNRPTSKSPRKGK
jgi:serine/threonine protein kinase